jgi:hypothetical protein
MRFLYKLIRALGKSYHAQKTMQPFIKSGLTLPSNRLFFISDCKGESVDYLYNLSLLPRITAC